MKKGQVFTLDVLIAIVIIIVGIAIIHYAFPAQGQEYYHTERLSEDVIGVLQATTLNDICVDPGREVTSNAPGCRCQNYTTIEEMACDTRLINTDADLLSFMTELIETRRVEEDMITDMIKEIFVENNVIDETRFGFAIVYTVPSADPSIRQAVYELYNTEKEN